MRISRQVFCRHALLPDKFRQQGTSTSSRRRSAALRLTARSVMRQGELHAPSGASSLARACAEDPIALATAWPAVIGRRSPSVSSSACRLSPRKPARPPSCCSATRSTRKVSLSPGRRRRRTSNTSPMSSSATPHHVALRLPVRPVVPGVVRLRLRLRDAHPAAVRGTTGLVRRVAVRSVVYSSGGTVLVEYIGP